MEKRKPKIPKEEFRKVLSFVQVLKALPDAQIFLKPVDPLAHNCPDYFDKIREPICIDQIHQKLYEYPDLSSFMSDLRLMIMNCLEYNPRGNHCRELGQSLGLWLMKQAKSLFEFDMEFGQFQHEFSIVKRGEERPKKRRLGTIGSLSLRSVDNVNSELASLSNTLSSINKQLESLERSQSSDDEPKENKSDHAIKKGKRKRSLVENRQCEYCHTTQTPMWRRGPSGKATLCNKCGVKWRAGRVLQHQDGTILQPPSPKTMSRPIKSATKSKKPIPESVTYAQKEHVASVLTLGTLNSDQLSHIVNMIKKNVKGLEDSCEEIELDIEQLDPKLVGEMYRYVVETVGLKPIGIL